MIDMAVAATAYSVANALGATPRVMLALFEAGLVESGFRNLNYGDRDSLGYLQQRPSQGWPDPTNVAVATRSFVTRAEAVAKANPSYSAGQIAQAVQKSAYPGRYDAAAANAQSLLDRVGGTAHKIVRTGTPLTSVGDIAGSLGNIASAANQIATGALNVGGLATQIAKLALPSNVMRAAAGAAGIAFIFGGLIMIGREVK